MKAFQTLFYTLAAISLLQIAAMPGNSSESANSDRSCEHKDAPNGWMYHAEHESDYQTETDETQCHSGKRCASLKSIVAKPRPFGNLMQYIDAKNYAGKRVRMSAWVKSKVESGTGQLWIRIDGDWESASKQSGCFDNMDDRPIRGTTDWKKYDLVVQLPPKSTGIAFGLMLVGKGQLWIDDVSLEVVSTDVPLTGRYVTDSGYASSPMNLNFEE